MDRNWHDFKSLHSNLPGAREAFEQACEAVFRKIYPTQNVDAVAVKQGDGGLDIFIGELGVEPITVIQCKFFLESFGESQKNQIRSSFNTAITSDKYELKEWILCMPRTFNIEEQIWWSKWKKTKIDEHKKSNSFITIKNGNELIDLFKEHDLYSQIFKIVESIRIKEIHEAIVKKPRSVIPICSPDIVLFNNYSIKCEDFYLEREIDKEFISSLRLNNLWVFGESGFGKTNLVQRNLIVNNLEFCYCDMSPINITGSDDVLEEILFSIEENFETIRECKDNNKIKQIVELLRKRKKGVTIVIDELSVEDNELLKEIARDLVKLVTHFRNSFQEGDLKFVVSTISNPRKIIENKSKAKEHFEYLNCDDWSENIETLFEMISKSLGLDLDSSKASILSVSKKSPRILKSIFRKILIMEDSGIEAVERVIMVVESELVD
jgi:hypothetical protein